MSFLQKLKSAFFDEETISQEIAVDKMKEEISLLNEKYQELLSFAEKVKTNYRDINNYELKKVEKYIDAMDYIKYKDINLIKEYEYLGIKYNILIELLIKIKKHINNYKDNMLLDFQFDKLKQPIFVLSPFKNDSKIILVKNTLFEEDYITYKINNDILYITDILSQENNVNHGTFMMNMLYNTIKAINAEKAPKINKIIIDKIMKKNIFEKNLTGFFKRHGFDDRDGEMVKSTNEI